MFKRNGRVFLTAAVLALLSGCDFDNEGVAGTRRTIEFFIPLVVVTSIVLLKLRTKPSPSITPLGE